jgi:hypothetical protein
MALKPQWTITDYNGRQQSATELQQITKKLRSAGNQTHQRYDRQCGMELYL